MKKKQKYQGRIQDFFRGGAKIWIFVRSMVGMVMQPAKPAGGGCGRCNPSHWGGMGGLPQENFQKLAPISCNLRYSEMIFVTYLKSYFLR